ncbi:acylneuraminate cytidylyltransferase family protein, partial [Candidatus Peregrinibacteria bacterium]|nr:acylneuraminate cytidylyltransferase family protein [Candidatus Peregrinibacteria bacterium]
MSKSLAIIPARGGSKRFPGKNTALFRGKPLVEHAIDVARESGVFAAICVSSDDPQVLSIAKSKQVDIIHERPADLATDTAQLKTVCQTVLEGNPGYDSFGLLIPVSPLRTPEDIRKAHALLQSKDVNTVLSVVRYTHSPLRSFCLRDGYMHTFFGKEFMKPDQQLTPLYWHDGTVVFCKTNSFLKENDFCGTGTV